MTDATGLSLSAVMAIFAIFANFAATATASLEPTRESLQSDRGEQIANASCGGCHDLRPIQTRALDKDGWTKIVSAETKNGAKVDPDDLPILIDFLVKNHGPLPDGPGKDILLTVCTMCHDLQRVRQQSGTREEWEETLGAMLNEGAPLSEQDFPVLLSYLAKNFKP